MPPETPHLTDELRSIAIAKQAEVEKETLQAESGLHEARLKVAAWGVREVRRLTDLAGLPMEDESRWSVTAGAQMEGGRAKTSVSVEAYAKGCDVAVLMSKAHGCFLFLPAPGQPRGGAGAGYAFAAHREGVGPHIIAPLHPSHKKGETPPDQLADFLRRAMIAYEGEDALKKPAMLRARQLVKEEQSAAGADAPGS